MARRARTRVHYCGHRVLRRALAQAPLRRLSVPLPRHGRGGGVREQALGPRPLALHRTARPLGVHRPPAQRLPWPRRHLRLPPRLLGSRAGRQDANDHPDVRAGLHARAVRRRPPRARARRRGRAPRPLVGWRRDGDGCGHGGVRVRDRVRRGEARVVGGHGRARVFSAHVCARARQGRVLEE